MERTVLTVAICTRNRPRDLERCIFSLVMAARLGARDEILVVDDGVSDESFVSVLRQQAEGVGFDFAYHRKEQSDGLYSSRRISSQLAQGNVVVFVDDDVEVAPDFLTRIHEHYDSDADLAGVGGFELGEGSAQTLGEITRQLFYRVFLLSSSSPGRLSMSGLNGSIVQWSSQSAPFETEYMLGFCMTFRRRAIANLVDIPWLVGYSLGEDLLVSQQANEHGRLLIDPQIRVAHHKSPINRWGEKQVTKHWMLEAIPRTQILRPTRLASLAMYWSLFGMVLAPAFKGRGGRFISALVGFVRCILRASLPSAAQPMRVVTRDACLNKK